MSDRPLVELKSVAVRRHSSLILEALDLVLDPGEIIGIRGPNGSGKTTLLRVIATLLRPSDGTARIIGADPTDQRSTAAVRTKIALVGHSPAVWPELTLRENLLVLPNVRRLGRAVVDREIEAVGLTQAADRRADRSSLGMVRRIEFARARLSSPQLLLLDEAHAGLDSAAAALVDDTAQLVRGRGGGVVVVSHELHRIGTLLNRTLELSNGQLVAA